MTYYQPYLSHPGAPGAGRSPESGYPPLTSQGYITSPGAQQYMQMQPTAFFPQNLQRTYAEVSPPSLSPVPPPPPPSQHRIELNPNAIAYQSYTSPSPPLHNSQQYPGGGDQRHQEVYQTDTCQMYQDGTKQYRGQPLFRPYQNGPEVMRLPSPKNHLQRPVTPHTLKSPIQTFNIPAPSFGGPSIPSTKEEATNGLTRSYPDDQSVFVRDSGQGIAVPSTSAEDLFKAKASLYGIEICTKAESLANAGRGKPTKMYLSKLSNGSDEMNAEKPTEMLFQKTHIEPEHSNDSDDSTTASSVIGESTACSTGPQQPLQNCDTSSTMKSTSPEKNVSPSNDNVYEPTVYDKDMFNSEEMGNQYLISPVELNGCVVYNEIAEHESEEKNKSTEIPVHLWSIGSCTNSLDSTGECDSFITALDENVSSASDGEIGILGNYVLEALMPTKAPQGKKTDIMQEASEPAVELGQYETTQTETVNTERTDQEHWDTLESLVEAYVKTIIEKACEVVSKKCYSSGECRHAVKGAEKADSEENISNFFHVETASEMLDYKVESLDLQVNFQKTKYQDEADGIKVKNQNKTEDTKVKHQNDAADSKAKYQDGRVDSISEQSSAGPASSSWDMAWNANSKSKDENSNYYNNNIAKVKEFHHDSESTEHSSDYSDSGSGSQLNPISPEFKPRRYLKSKSLSVNTSTMRPEAPVFQPLNVQTLPLFVKRKLKEGSCQTEEKEYKEVASNTRRVKQTDRVSETVSCDTREVCVNTMESCFSEDTEFFLAEEMTYSEQGTLTESLDKKSIGVLVKPHALDACTVNKETMTEPVPDYLESLIATQRELLHLRGDVCTLELKRQIHELERSKQMFQNMRGEPLDKVVDDRITSLKIELNIIQNQVVSYDAHLLAGNVWKTVPRFTVSIPVGGQNIRIVNKDLNQRPSVPNVGTKRSIRDAYSSEEEHLLHDLGTNHPAKISSKVHYHQPKSEESSKSRAEASQPKPPQSFSFTSVKSVGNDSSIDGTKPGKIMENRKQGQTTCQMVKTEITDVTNPKADQAPVMNMDDIDDDVSLPEFPKTPPLKPLHVTDNTTRSGGDPASDRVKKEIIVQSDNYANSQVLCKGGSSAAMEIVSQTFNKGPMSVSKDSRKVLSSDPLFAEDLNRPALSTSLSVTQNTKFTTFSNGPTSVSVTAPQDSSLTTFPNGPTRVTAAQDNSLTTFSSVPTIVTGTPCSSITTFSSGPPGVTIKTQTSSITTSSNGPTTVSSVHTPLPVSHIPVSSCNMTHSRSIITNQVQTSNRQNVASQLAQLMTGNPLLATPRIIPGQQGVALLSQVHQANVTPYMQIRQPSPSLPPYPLVRQIQPSIIPYSQVLPVQPSILSYPVVRTSLLPQPQPMAKIPTSVYQGNPLFQSPQTSPSLGLLSRQGDVSSTAGQMNTSSVPIPNKSSVPLGQTSNPSGQPLNIPEQIHSTAVQGQMKGSSSVPSSSAPSCPVTSTIQTTKPSGKVNGPSVDPDLYQAVINQLRQAYPQMATDPVWLETVGAQQTLVLQNYIDASKNTAPNKDADDTTPQAANSSSNNSSSESQRKEDSYKLRTYPKSKVPNGDISQSEVITKQQSVIDEPCLTNNASVVPRRPPGLASLTDTDNSLSQKFENIPDFSMKDLDGGAKGLVKTISDLTKLTGNESKDILPNEQKLTEDDRTVVLKSSMESKLSQKPKSLLDNFKRVEIPVVHEPKVSTVYPDMFEKQDYSTQKDMDLYTIHSNHSHNRSKRIPSRQRPTSESDKASGEALRNPSPKSVGGENWENEVDQDPKPFRHDFRKVRPAEKTKSSWMSEMSKTNMPPGLPLKKPTVKTTEGKNDLWDAPRLGQGSSGSNITSTVSYSRKVEQWLNLNQPSTDNVLVRNKSPEDSETGDQSGSLYSSCGGSTPRGDVRNLDSFDLAADKDVGEGMNKEGTSGMSVIPLASKGLKTTGDLDNISDGEGESWHQVSKKKKEKKRTEAERPRRKSGSDVSSSKSNNFEKLITKMSEVFSTLSRERIIQLITEVRNETKGLSGMNMKQIIDLSRQIFISKRHYYQTDPKQRHSSGGSPVPTSQKANKPVPLPIVGMAPLPGPGKTFNFKPLSMSVIQPSKDLPLMDDEEEICVICHDALIMEEIKTLECGHVFHSDCIKQWVFGQERTCPNCRRLALFPEEFPRLGK
ncbi:uncharacterized protein LOC110448436 isoform X2 [Mizuhopecten yessoensis]|uniref:uncharacterized protein LOC110448436 isoform X2 n=1 Tax=Mizuhopecten yessoensis TaxID=6573 RepID=UPI000B45ACE5|nr:uncharacterized protein LOC110448436 isoform X2 [Mizuhopecten yessoensis]